MSNSDTNLNASKIFINSIILYGRMIFTMLLSLISTKIGLNVLGTEDFGIFNLIAGIIGLLGFLSITMAIGTQRYLSFFLGAGNMDLQKKIFAQSWLLHILIAVVCCGSLLIFSSVLFNYFFNINSSKLNAAETIYYVMSFSVFFTILSVPFIAVITTRENMLMIGSVSVLEACLKLVAAFSVNLFSDSDKLIYYGYLMGGISFITFLSYSLFSLTKYEECDIKLRKIDLSIMRKLVSFTGWNLLGSLARLGKIQGIAVILNMFYGTVINTSVGIANQVSGSLNFLSASFVRALNPQIMSSVGAGDLQRSIRLSLVASKFGFLILAAFVIPISFEMENILNKWLTIEVPYLAVFSILMVVSILLEQLTIGILSAMQAIGKIKLLQLGVSIVWLLTIPLGYILLRNNYPAYYVMASLIITEIIATIYRIILAGKILGISPIYYSEYVFGKSLAPTATGILVSVACLNFFEFEYRFLLTISISVICFSAAVYYFTLNDFERTFVKGRLERSLQRVW